MNFLAHLWLAERAQVPLAGAILGDVLAGALPPQMPTALARSVRLHRLIDAATDRHPRIVAARRAFAPGARRYAGIVIDLLCDHILAQDWTAFCDEPLPQFAERAAAAVAGESAWFVRAGASAPAPRAFAELLVSYATAAGLERAVQRTSRRLRRPEGLVGALAGWPTHVPPLRRDLPELLRDLRGIVPEADPWRAPRASPAGPVAGG